MYVSAKGVVRLDVGAVARSIEPGSVWSGDTENIKSVDTAPRGAAGIKIRDMPCQGRVRAHGAIVVMGGGCKGYVEDRQ